MPDSVWHRSSGKQIVWKRGKMSEARATLSRRNRKIPRAAAIASILFAQLFGTGVVLIRVSIVQRGAGRGGKAYGLFGDPSSPHPFPSPNVGRGEGAGE